MSELEARYGNEFSFPKSSRPPLVPTQGSYSLYTGGSFVEGYCDRVAKLTTLTTSAQVKKTSIYTPTPLTRLHVIVIHYLRTSTILLLPYTGTCRQLVGIFDRWSYTNISSGILTHVLSVFAREFSSVSPRDLCNRLSSRLHVFNTSLFLYSCYFLDYFTIIL
jgi:hypothetical protein